MSDEIRILLAIVALLIDNERWGGIKKNENGHYKRNANRPNGNTFGR